MYFPRRRQKVALYAKISEKIKIKIFHLSYSWVICVYYETLAEEDKYSVIKMFNFIANKSLSNFKETSEHPFRKLSSFTLHNRWHFTRRTPSKTFNDVNSIRWINHRLVRRMNAHSLQRLNESACWYSLIISISNRNCTCSGKFTGKKNFAFPRNAKWPWWWREKWT